MSREPAGSSPVPETPTLAARLGAALTWLQGIGHHPVVNPSRNPWTPPPTRVPWVVWFAGAFLALTALFLYWFFVADGGGGFIYTGF
ncbi:MAG TPA: hypothetical protein VLS51_02990 [Propionibacteriaceae bacterium]|nr:hypothetical protein [Propionibacteriaceae bacterium]